MTTVLHTLLGVLLTSRRDRVNYWVSKALVSGLYPIKGVYDTSASSIFSIAAISSYEFATPFDEVHTSKFSLGGISLRDIVIMLDAEPDSFNSNVFYMEAITLRGVAVNIGTTVDSSKASGYALSSITLETAAVKINMAADATKASKFGLSVISLN